MVVTIYSNGCPNCGKNRSTIAKAQKLLSQAFHTVVVKNNRYDVQARTEHAQILREHFGIGDRYPTVMYGENKRAVLLTPTTTQEEIYGILRD